MTCKCGCGSETLVPEYSDRSKGWIKGEPREYVKGHALRDLQRESKGWVTTQGYRMLNLGKRGEKELEHRIVAGAQPGDVVHHINGDKLDNRPENLQVMTQSEHVRLHLHSPHWESA